MTKEKTYKEQKTEQERGKKRYITRVIETEEAKKAIKEYLKHKKENQTYEDLPTIRPFT